MGTTLLAIVLASFAMSARLRGKPGPTPKAADLGDHFGTEPVKNLYGPKAPIAIVNLMREGITGRDTPITPITNFYKEVNPLQVVNGGLDNTSYDASKIIKPMIAAPKFDIKNAITHEAVIKTPVHMGMTVEEKTIETMNRVTGKTTKKTITTEKPNSTEMELCKLSMDYCRNILDDNMYYALNN